MFRSYFMATLRTLLKNRGLTAINILGLAIGMASVILIVLYIQYEFSYDRHHANATRIHRVFRAVSMENTTLVNPRASLYPSGFRTSVYGIWRYKAGVCLWTRRGFYSRTRLCQFYESLNGALIHQSARGGIAKGSGCISPTIDRTIFGRISTDGTRCNAGLTIFVACLGLFGLISFRAEQKTKEIGIRKVLGASVFSIFGLLSIEFVKLVIIACAIASPIAYLFSSRWLQDFAYRIDLHLMYFLIGGVLALLLALATMTYQALKAARTNPVDALRTE